MLPPFTWKGLQMDYDELSLSGDGSCCICLSERAMQMILAVSDQFHWTTRYYSPTAAAIDAETVDEWASALERQIVSGLNDCCGSDPSNPTLTRLSIDGVVEISTDGGETWTEAPGLDPRITSMQFPPLLGEDGETKQCQAATNLAEYAEAWVEQLADVLDVGGLVVAAIAEAAAIFLSAGVLVALAAPLGGLLISLGGSALRAAFDSETWDNFRCDALCCFGEDGLLTAGGWADLINRVNDYPGAAGVILSGLLQLMGVLGCNNIAASGSAAGDECNDCDDCECDPSVSLSPGSFNLVEGVSAEIFSTKYQPAHGNRAWLTEAGDVIRLTLDETAVGHQFESARLDQFSGGAMDSEIWIDGVYIRDYEWADRGNFVPISPPVIGNVLEFRWASGDICSWTTLWVTWVCPDD